MRRSRYTGKMKIALISDIHGNLVALEAALADIAADGVDLTLCLGDVAATGPDPNAVVERLRHEDIPVVMGNTDAWLLAPEPAKPDVELTDDERKLLEVEEWGAAQLGDVEQAMIGRFAPTLSVDLGDGLLLAYHGSPSSFNHPIRPDTSDEQLDAWFDGRPAALFAGGHTHIAMLRPYRDALVVNPGSVGLPFFTLSDGQVINPAWAEYAILNWTAERQTVEFRRVRYAMDDLRAAVTGSGMPHGAWYLRDWREASN